VRRTDVPEDSHITTNFLDNQAREASKPLFSKTPFKIVLGIVAAGLIFGIYQLVVLFRTWTR
jgi:hypothetical protein